MKTVIILPARYDSKRLPGKLLLNIGGKPLIQHVYECVSNVKWADTFISAADDEMERAAKQFTDNVIRVDDTCCGTHSVYKTYINKELDYDIICNVQADNFSLKKETLDKLYWHFCKFHYNGIITAHYKSFKDDDKNRVKVVLGNGNRSLYFSREPIPHNSKEHNIHVGIYYFWENTLLDIGRNYDVYGMKYFRGENLEQLDWIYDGHSIYSFEVEQSVSIDSLSDYEKIKNERIS